MEDIAIGAENRTLFFARAPHSAAENDVKTLFSAFGRVEAVKCFRTGGQPGAACLGTKGCGLVKMATAAEAEAAIKGLHDTFTWSGMPGPMVVRWMEPDSQHRRRASSRATCTRAGTARSWAAHARASPAAGEGGSVAMAILRALMEPVEGGTVPASATAKAAAISSAQQLQRAVPAAAHVPQPPPPPPPQLSISSGASGASGTLDGFDLTSVSSSSSSSTGGSANSLRSPRATHVAAMAAAFPHHLGGHTQVFMDEPLRPFYGLSALAQRGAPPVPAHQADLSPLPVVSGGYALGPNGELSVFDSCWAQQIDIPDAPPVSMQQGGGAAALLMSSATFPPQQLSHTRHASLGGCLLLPAGSMPLARSPPPRLQALPRQLGLVGGMVVAGSGGWPDAGGLIWGSNPTHLV